MSTAWMLRQDGEAFPIKVHIYVMNDADLSSEAEAASFIYCCGTQDKDLAESVLVAWVAELINPKLPLDASFDEILSTISSTLQNLPYKFPYSVSTDRILDMCQKSGHFESYDSLSDYLFDIADERPQLSMQIKLSLNQQFARVRFGGQYNTVANNPEIWCRVSSIGFNWADTFYQFIMRMKRRYNIQFVTICRDAESDYPDITHNVQEYFYKAKDGAVYYHMPIEEYLAEEHEHSPVFATSEIGQGVRFAIRQNLAAGATVAAALQSVFGTESALDVARLHANYVSEAREACVASDMLTDDSLPTRTKRKMLQLKGMILRQYKGTITDVQIDYQPREGFRGGSAGFELNFLISSPISKLDGVAFRCHYNHDLSQTELSTIFRQFRQEFAAYVEYGM